MLYKKNKEKTLSKELFENPTCEYRGAPFWSWNCSLSEEILREQIGYLDEMGFGGFHMHTRAGMSTEYMSEEFLELAKVCNDEGKKRNMLTWLYDEDMWPSGFAGGYVTKNPEYRQRFLVLYPEGTELPGLSEKEEAIKTGGHYYLCTYDIVLNEKGELLKATVIGQDDKAEGKKWTAVCKVAMPIGRFNGYTYVDTLNPEATDLFIKETHEKYKKALGDEFSKTVPAIFTDEPQFARKNTLAFATSCDKEVSIGAWTPKMPRLFKEATGLDIFDVIPELIWNLPDNEVSRKRYVYHDFITELFVKSFADRIGKWCDENGIMLTGHVQAEDFLWGQTAEVGEAMRAYRAFGLQGVDILCNAYHYTTVKQAQSASHQYGKEGVLSELYGVTNWDFDFRGHKMQGDWQAALGVTVRVPHLSWISMAGEAKRDYPASINYQSPWYKEYKYIEDHFSRVNTALTRGKSVVKVGVIHPIESYWINWGPAGSTADVREQMDSRFKNLCEWLLFGTIDYDYICESTLPAIFGGCSDGKFNVGAMGYSAVVVPALQTIRGTTLKALEEFAQNGGKVIFAGKCPEYVDAVKSDAAKELYENSICVGYENLEILNALEAERDVEIRTSSGNRCESLIYNMRKDNDANWLFVARGKNVYKKPVFFHPATDINAPKPEKIRIFINDEVTPVLYNTLDGTISPVSCQYENGRTAVDVVMYADSSVLLKLLPGRGVEDSAVSLCESFKAENEIKWMEGVELKYDKKGVRIDLKGTHDYILDEPNVLLLDTAEFAFDDGEFEPEEEILRLDNICRARIGMVGKQALPQPWALEDTDSGHTITLRIKIKSEIKVNNARLAIEDAEKHQFTFNGKPIIPVIDGFFTDKDIKTFTLPTIEKGENILTVKLKLNKRSNTEWCYVLGDFGVRVEGTEKTIIKKIDKIGYSPLKTQAMPFYGGNITYINEIETPDCNLEIKAPFYKGAVIKAYLDGKDLGYIAFAPYSIKVSDVTAGKHKIEFKLFGNRHNSFGALHNTIACEVWFGPGAWRTAGDEYSYEYQLKDMGILAAPSVTIFEK